MNSRSPRPPKTRSTDARCCGGVRAMALARGTWSLGVAVVGVSLACGDPSRAVDEATGVPPVNALPSSGVDDALADTANGESASPEASGAPASADDAAPAADGNGAERGPSPVGPPEMVEPEPAAGDAEPESASDEAPADEAPADEAPSEPVEPPAAALVGPDPDPALRAACEGESPISCHFGGSPGNYEVTVVLGGPAAANTVVLAEARRVMLGPIATAAGESRRFTFVVNVRQPEGQPIQNVPAGTPGLDLYFRGDAGAPPALQSIGYAPAESPFVIYIAGDSTVCDQTDVEYGGWGQQLPRYFDYPVVVANYADSGESSGSFLNAAPLFRTVERQLAPDDWVLIQFGHNDKNVTGDQFHANLTSMVTRVKDRGAFPVLITPVARAQFSMGQVAVQHVNGTGADLPQIVAQVAAEQQVPLLDMTARTSEWLSELGPNGWQAFHALGTDRTHTNDAGAAVEAGFVRDLIEEAGLAPLLAHLR